MTETRAPELAEAIAEKVLAHPAVAGLHGGALDVVATYLPGRKIVGVRAAEKGDPVGLSVVLRLGGRLPDVAAQLRGQVRALAGDVPVDIEIADVVTDDGTPDAKGAS